MVFSVVGAALASENESTGKTITLTGGKKGHTYTLYQIFTGTIDGTELTNIQWGSDANASLKAAHATAAAYAEEIATLNDARATAQALVAGNYLGTGTSQTLTADGTVEFTGLDEGYYMIIDTNNNTSVVEGDYSSAYVVKVVNDVSGALKGSGATSDKEVVEKSGSAAQNDAAAYDIGDAVPFNLNATTANNVSSYKKYHITFQDKQSAGLTAPTSWTVTVLGKTFTVTNEANPAAQTTENGTQITVTKAAADEGNTFAIKVEFEPVAVGQNAAATYLDSECNSIDIVVSYTSVLNDSAVVGLPGNDNKVHITYSNNPEDEDGGDEGKTPDDTVVVFTYKPVIDKYDSAGNALAGAGFTQYKEVPQGTTGATLGSELTFGTGVEHSAIESTKYYVTKAMTLVGSSTNEFSFEGLADGTYVLVETTIPTGFNAFTSVKFTISSTVTESGISTLTGGSPFTLTNPGEDEAVTATNGHKLDSGELYAEIENNSGKELPQTGGMGTTIIYVVGAVLVLGAAAVILARRKAEQQ